MILYPTALSMRQKPPAGSRLAQPITGGFWLPGANGGVSDASGGNAPGVISGGVTRVQGPFGGPALKFDGSTGFVTVALNGNNTQNWSTRVPIPRTVWAWIRRPSSTSSGPVFFKGNNSPNSGFGLSILTTGIRVTWIGSFNNHLDTTTALTVNDWHFVAVSYDGVDSTTGFSTSVSISVDGKLDLRSNVTLGAQNSPDSFDMLLGKAAYVGGIDGAPVAFADLEIDHWGYDHRMYGPEEIADLYARPFRNFAPAPIFGRFSAGSAAAAARPRIFVCT